MDATQDVIQTLQGHLPNLLAAMGILVAGVLVAMFAAWLVRAMLKRTTVDNRVAEWVTGQSGAKAPQIEKAVARVVFVAIMLFVIVAFFEALGLTLLTQPLNQMLNEFLVFLPRLGGAVILVVVAWAVASMLRIVVRNGLEKLGLDDRVSQQEPGVEGQPLSRTLAEVVYWLVLLLFFPAVLGALALEGLLVPVQSLVDEVLSFIPNVVTAAAILGLGWFVARALQRIVTQLLAAIGTDRLGEQVRIQQALGPRPLSRVLGLVVYILVLVPVNVGGLNALRLDAVTQPASEMLGAFLGALPLLFAAAILLAIAYVVGRVLGGMATSLLEGVGFDRLLTSVGYRGETQTPSKIAGTIVVVAVMLFAAIEAFGLMGFEHLADLTRDLVLFGGDALVSVAVFGLGLYLAKLAARAVSATGIPHAAVLAPVVRGAILVLVSAMALRQLGVAEEIITLAFGLTLGAGAVAVALAFGLGGRDIAARQLNQWSAGGADKD